MNIFFLFFFSILFIRLIIWLTWKILSWATLKHFVIHLLPGPSHIIKLTVPVTCIYLYTYLVSKGVTYFLWTPVNLFSTSNTTFYNQAGSTPPLDEWYSTNFLSFNFWCQIQPSKYLYEDTYVFLFFLLSYPFTSRWSHLKLSRTIYS